MKKIFSIVFVLFLFYLASAQSSAKDSLQKTRAARMEKLAGKLVYPLIKAGKWSGVVPVNNPTEIPDPNLNYKLLFELVANNKDTAAKDINAGITEICRIINLHVASGIPVKNISPVIVVHGPALFSMFNNDNYNKKYKVDNPNISVIEEMITKTGAKFIACGQAMSFLEVTPEQMIPQIKISLTAITVLSGYELKGYKLYEITEERLK